MTKVLVLYHSRYGHIAAMAKAAAEGARQSGVEVNVKRVPEVYAESETGVFERAKAERKEPVATVEEIPDYDAILFGTPTHFGNMSAPMKHFVDRLSGHWMADALVGKVGGVFTSSGSQHGGQEHTLLSFQASLMHLGMLVVGLPYSFKDQMRMDEITGGSPYGATTLAMGADGDDRRASATELDGARFQGRHVAETALALVSGRAALAPDTASITEDAGV